MMRVTVRASIGKPSTYAAFVTRREMLQQLVEKQIGIAQKLAQTEGAYSRDTMWAWDVVEELSRKLNMVDLSLINMRMEPLRFRDKSMYDRELAQRVYDV
jgi:hypothetical protein